MKNVFLYPLILIVILFNQTPGVSLFVTDKSTTQIVKSEKSSKPEINELDEIYSDKKLGSFVLNDTTYFNLFAPNAHAVNLYIFDSASDENGKSIPMKKDADGVWGASVAGELYGKFYGYRVKHPGVKTPIEKLPLCIDPYAKAFASFTTYYNPRKSIIHYDNYDWGSDKWIERDWRDLIIYEMHVRDMTAHQTSGSTLPGTYKGLVEKNITGGIEYIKKLGVNTVEILPAMEFGNCEIPFEDSLKGKFNTWNPYERNHWGYMTAGFFAPTSYYALTEFKWNEWMGADSRQVNDFKDMVKSFHENNIAVIMDVVYNHLSEYETGNLKQIDREYYFRLNDDGTFKAQSGCGNDIKTERPMVRRLIVESILFWMKEYHIDGFRFDLGKLIDWETIEEIIREARKLNPNVVFVCEPWGGGYDPRGFSLREWGSWNDQIRNGIKGENPNDGLGWIFGKWYGNNNQARLKSYINGTLVDYKYGLFQKAEHSVNYLESHDGLTLGDFIRIGSGEVDPQNIITDVDKNVKLSPHQMKLNKLAALFLFTSQGITMIHSGQEFARSKVIPMDIKIPDMHKGHIDHNSYEKDNETNYINYKHAEINTELFEYYRGLIEIRKRYDAFRHASPEDIAFFNITDNDFAIGFQVTRNSENFIVLMNADQNLPEDFILPEGNWEVIVNSKSAGTEALAKAKNEITVEPISGIILRKIK